MKLKLVIAIAALQVGLLLFMAGQREWIAQFGQPITLRTAPIDPIDPMRGAFVRLNYEIGFIPANLCQGEAARWISGFEKLDWRGSKKLRDTVVYLRLAISDDGFAEAVALDTRKPTDSPFLRGRVTAVNRNGVEVRYGIEAMFMSQQRARETEHLSQDERTSRPMNVTVKVGQSGVAVLDDFTWEQLGISVGLNSSFSANTSPRKEIRTPSAESDAPSSCIIHVTLQNFGDQDIAIVDLPAGKSFRLVANQRSDLARYAWVGADKNVVPVDTVAAFPLRVLSPGEKYEVKIDLADPHWHIVDLNDPSASPTPMSEITGPDSWLASFRIEYAPPPAAAIKGLPHADIVQHRRIQSRAFNAALKRID